MLLRLAGLGPHAVPPYSVRTALSGINVAGKTGTAEVDNATSNQAWFIGFAPVERPRVAVAVTVERTQGQGGTVAAPIAAQVIEALLAGG